jgi:hypothetical protein
VAVYRRRNARVIEAFLKQCPSNAEVRLWALDGATDFSPVTIGRGPGGKFKLINELVHARPVDDDAWLVVADDDIVFSVGNLERFLSYCQRANLDLAQPSHSVASYYSHPFTVSRPWSRVRLTGFVECGPLFAVSPTSRRRVFPFYDAGMGWGIEAAWNDLMGHGVRLGIVDACRMVHLSPVGQDYSEEEEERRVLATYGTRPRLKTVQGTWYRWHKAPNPSLEPGLPC